MKIIQPSVEFISPIDGKEILSRIEQCGRVCYKSEDRIADGSAEAFCRGIIKRGHEAVLEHASFTVKFVCDRGVSHEIVRHRLAAYCQESTRYCNYSTGKFDGEITVIKPCYMEIGTGAYEKWKRACEIAEYVYFDLLKIGLTPQEARAVLPNSLKTEICMTADIREWRHFFKLRCAPAAHPQMREVATQLLIATHEKIPVLFDDIYAEVFADNVAAKESNFKMVGSETTWTITKDGRDWLSGIKSKDAAEQIIETLREDQKTKSEKGGT